MDAQCTAYHISDEEIVTRILAGERELFEVLLRRHSTRIYRVIVSMLGNETEVENVMVEAYVRAFHELPSFSGETSFSTWLTQQAVATALQCQKNLQDAAFHPSGRILFAAGGRKA